MSLLIWLWFGVAMYGLYEENPMLTSAAILSVNVYVAAGMVIKKLEKPP